MYDDAKTVSGDVDLYLEQVNHTAQMRNQLVSFNKSDPMAAKKALQNITILRVYHQITRIIKYTQMMDKVEEKLYEVIDATLEEVDNSADTKGSLYTLLSLQERLQKCMIESHKLLEPYLNMEALTAIEVKQEDDTSQTFAAMIMDQESREKLRTSAQQVLAALERGESNA